MVKKIADPEQQLVAPGNHKYDWQYLASGQWFELQKGVDFTVELEAFRTNCLAWARLHSYKATTRKLSEDRIAIKLQKKAKAKR